MGSKNTDKYIENTEHIVSRLEALYSDIISRTHSIRIKRIAMQRTTISETISQ